MINELVFQRQFSVCGLLVILLIKVSHIWMVHTFYLYCPSIMCSEFFIMRFCTNARVRLLTSSILVHMPPNFIIFDASQKMHHIFCCFSNVVTTCNSTLPPAAWERVYATFQFMNRKWNPYIQMYRKHHTFGENIFLVV